MLKTKDGRKLRVYDDSDAWADRITDDFPLYKDEKCRRYSINKLTRDTYNDFETFFGTVEDDYEAYGIAVVLAECLKKRHDVVVVTMKRHPDEYGPFDLEDIRDPRADFTDVVGILDCGPYKSEDVILSYREFIEYVNEPRFCVSGPDDLMEAAEETMHGLSSVTAEELAETFKELNIEVVDDFGRVKPVDELVWYSIDR